MKYTDKKKLGLVPHHYDRNSQSFKAGAWKNWSDRERRELHQLNERNRRINIAASMGMFGNV